MTTESDITLTELSDLNFLNLNNTLECIINQILMCRSYILGPNHQQLLTKDVLCLLNEKLGTDVDNFKKHLDEIRELEDFAKKEFIEDVVSAANRIDEISKEYLSKKNELCGKLRDINILIDGSKDTIEYYNTFLRKLFNLSVQMAYLKAISDSKYLSNKITNNLESNDLEKAIDNYLSLCDISHSLLQSKCYHLNQYLNDSIHYWNGLLKNNLSQEFATIMKSVHWPFVSSNSLTSILQPDAMATFQTFVQHLLLIQLPLDVQKRPSVSSTVVVNFPIISLPMTLLIQPLRKRFIYHFSGNRKTNRVDKPEWYFSQILTWIHDHENFVARWVEPVYSDLGVNRSASLELMCGLVQVCLEKLQTDLDQAHHDDALFSHTVDEALGFHKELTDTYPYPQSIPSTPAILTQAPIFIKWLNMERKYARDKMDCMLSSDTAWCDVSADDHITEVGHSFLAMLSAITDRFSSLPQPGHRLQFIDLELELIDDLRVSLLQVLHSERADPLNSKLASVLNTVHFLHSSLQQWDISPSMLLLNHYKNQFQGSANLQDDSEGGIFEGSLSLLLRLQNDLISALSEAIMLEVKAKSRPYRTDKWMTMGEEEVGSGSLTPSACAMYQVLADKLHQMSDKLAAKLFQLLIKSVASHLNTYLFEELLLENAFSPYGGRVLERDVMKCLLPLFQQYSQSSCYNFSQLKEACAVLSLANLPLPVKKAALVGSNFELFNSLPIDMRHLTKEEVSFVIKRRSDTMTQFM